MATNRRETAAHKPPPVPRVGSYELVRQIASGGMGRVFLARHAFLHRYAAVKLLREDLPDKERLLQMFRAEAQSLAKVVHPNVVQVLDIGRDHGFDFIAMDFAPGKDLAKRLRDAGRLEKHQIVGVAQKVLEAIAAAHAVGVLHRDIKPDNILLDDHGGVKVTDFGLAGDIRMVAAGLSRQTHATPAYAAPEVLRGWRSDFRSDVFSIGATLYHCATGLLPFGMASRQSVLAAQKKGAQPIHELCPDLPKHLASAIMAAIDSDEEMRPADAGEFFQMAFPDYRPPRRAGSAPRWLVPAVGALVGCLIPGAWVLWPPETKGQDPNYGETTPGSGSPPVMGGAGATETRRGDSPAARETLTRLITESRESRASLELSEIGFRTAPLGVEARRAALREFAQKHEGTEAAVEARRQLGDGPAALTRDQQSEILRVRQLFNSGDTVAGLMAFAALPAPVSKHPEAASIESMVSQADQSLETRWMRAVRSAETMVMRGELLRAAWLLDLPLLGTPHPGLGTTPVPPWLEGRRSAAAWQSAEGLRAEIAGQLAGAHRSAISRVWEGRWQAIRGRANRARELDRVARRLITDAAQGSPVSAMATFQATDWTLAGGSEAALGDSISDVLALHSWMKERLTRARNQPLSVPLTAADGKTAISHNLRITRVEDNGFEATGVTGPVASWVSYGMVHPKAWVDLSADLSVEARAELFGRLLSLAQLRQISFERSGLPYGPDAVADGRIPGARLDQIWWLGAAQPLTSRLAAIVSVGRQLELGRPIGADELRLLTRRDREAVEAHWVAVESAKAMVQRPSDILPPGAWSPWQADGAVLRDPALAGVLAVYAGQIHEAPAALLDPVLLGLALEAGPPSAPLAAAILKANPEDAIAARVLLQQTPPGNADSSAVKSAYERMPNDPDVWRAWLFAGLASVESE